MSMKETIEKGQNEYLKTYGSFPISIKSGNGCYLTDEDGKEYLDFLAGIAVNALGYNNEDLNRALKNQIDSGMLHVSNLFYNPVAVSAAEKLNKLAGSSKVFFCNSGSEANEAAIKLARKYGNKKGKNKIISFYHSFHGRTYGSITLTGQEKYQQGFEPMLPGIVYANFNDLESVEKLISDETCAIIVEPIQGEGGLIPAEKSFLKGIRKICDDKDIILIFDEVQTGIGRSGNVFCFQHYGVQPDLLTSAKALGCGVPIGALLSFEKCKDVFSPGDHATTFGGNALSTAAANVILDKLEEGSLLNHVNEVSAYLKEELIKLKDEFPKLITDVRGVGLMYGLELTVAPRDVVQGCIDNGLLIASAGYTVLRFVPPLVISKSEITKGIEIVKTVLTQFSKKSPSL